MKAVRVLQRFYRFKKYRSLVIFPQLLTIRTLEESILLKYILLKDILIHNFTTLGLHKNPRILRSFSRKNSAEPCELSDDSFEAARFEAAWFDEVGSTWGERLTQFSFQNIQVGEKHSNSSAV